MLKVSKLSKLMKTSYLSYGLKVYNQNDDSVIVIEGYNWAVRFKRSDMPKEVLGELVKYTGELPEKDEAFNYTESGKQVINNLIDERFMEEPNQIWNITNIRIALENRILSILEDENEEKHLVITNLLDVVDEKKILKRIEEGDEIYQCYSDKDKYEYVMWSDGLCTYLVDLIKPGNNKLIDEYLDRLKEVNCNFEK